MSTYDEDEDLFGGPSAAEQDDTGVDLSGVDEAPPRKILPPGIYTAVISGVEQGRGKESGEPYWHLTLTVQDEKFLNETLHDRLSLSWSRKQSQSGVSPAQRSITRLSQLTGIPVTRLQRRITLLEMEPELVGKPVRVKVKNGSYNDEPTNEVERVYPIPQAGGSAPTPAPAPTTEPTSNGDTRPAPRQRRATGLFDN